MRMQPTRLQLEVEFLRICRTRGPRWIESVIRPLRLQNKHAAVQDIPSNALRRIVDMFGRAPDSPGGIPVV